MGRTTRCLQIISRSCARTSVAETTCAEYNASIDFNDGIGLPCDLSDCRTWQRLDRALLVPLEKTGIYGPTYWRAVRSARDPSSASRRSEALLVDPAIGRPGMWLTPYREI